MLSSSRFKLLSGPYRTPRVRLGAVLFDEVRDCEVVVCGLTDARIPWPIGKAGRARTLVLYGSLAEAVRKESRIAVCHWFGVTGQTVTKWRKALGVPVTNEGTHRLRSEYTEEEWSIEARRKGQAKNADPTRREKIGAALRGKPRPWKVIKAVIDAHTGSKHSVATKAKMSATHKARGTRPSTIGRAWTAEEDGLVRTLPAAKAAVATRRTLSAVYSRRHVLMQA